ncbi:MAG TPA: anti-sigma factor [Sphingomonas sp.]|nr:anti-sigma factor [Sphingomonas sp.]
MSDERPDDDLLAAELALGVLRGEERVAVEARRAADPAFAVLVAAWEGRFAPLLAAVPEIEPPAGLWSAIERATAASPPVSDLVLARMKRQRDLWRGYGGLVSVAAAALLVVVVSRPIPLAPSPSIETTRPSAMMSATLAMDDGKPALVISYEPGSRSLVITEVGMPPADGHSHELWLIGADGKPVAIGVMGGAGGETHRMPMPVHVAVPIGSAPTLAISIEPPGGSPTGQPTGPVIAKGALSPV